MFIQKVNHWGKIHWLAPVFWYITSLQFFLPLIFWRTPLLFSFTYVLGFSSSLFSAFSPSLLNLSSLRWKWQISERVAQRIWRKRHNRVRARHGRERERQRGWVSSEREGGSLYERDGERERIYWYKTTVVSLQCVWERPWVKTRWSAGTDEDCHWVSECTCTSVWVPLYFCPVDNAGLCISLTTC